MAIQYSCLENPHGQRSLAGYSSWGLKDSDMTATKHNTQHIADYSVSGVSKLTPLYTHFRFFSIIGYYKILNRVPCLSPLFKNFFFNLLILN